MLLILTLKTKESFMYHMRVSNTSMEEGVSLSFLNVKQQALGTHSAEGETQRKMKMHLRAHSPNQSELFQRKQSLKCSHTAALIYPGRSGRQGLISSFEKRPREIK